MVGARAVESAEQCVVGEGSGGDVGEGEEEGESRGGVGIR